MSSSATVLITGDDTGLGRTLNGVGASMSRFGSAVATAGVAAGAAFAALGAAVGYALHEGANAVAGYEKLRAAIGDTADADALVEKLKASASAMQVSTRYGDDYVLSLYTMAAGMGVAHDQLEQTTNAAIALSQATGGSLGVEQAMRSLIKATEADEIALKRFIPQLGSATNAMERQAIIQDAIARGQRVLVADSNSFSGSLARITNAVSDVAEGIGVELLPYFQAVTDWFVDSVPTFNAWAGAALKAFGDMLNFVSPVFDAIGAGWVYVRDMAVDVAAIVVTAWEQPGKALRIVWDSIQLGAVQTFNIIEHFFTVAVPAYFQWFGENWYQLFETAYNYTTTVFTNLLSNIGDFFSAVYAWMQGDEFDFTWTSLTKGFENTLKALPEIADREIGALEKEIGERLQNASAGFGADALGKVAEFRNALGLDSIAPPLPPSVGDANVRTQSRPEKQKAEKAEQSGAGQFVALDALWTRITAAALKGPEQRAADKTADASDRTARSSADLVRESKSQTTSLEKIAAGVTKMASGDGVAVLGD